ncbi:MAG TPA: ParB/RepB/Spo0J family partition protein [Myxococcales bacterium]|nr:ParB/RepB/Spo0J family partition protein [Myxococcales bacterium]
MPAAKDAPGKKTARKRTPRRKAGSFGLGAPDVTTEAPPAEIEQLARDVEADGGRVIGRYREPYGGRWLLLCALPIERVSPTPYQRDLSETHVARLATAVEKVGSFLDPIVVVRGTEGGEPKYFTPNGHHRLGAMRKLGARSIVALLVPDKELEYQILALNTEKAHNLREKSSEVLRMARGLADLGGVTEAQYAFQFEEAPLLVLGVCYEQRPRFSGSAYHPILRRTCSEFLDRPLKQALHEREAQAKRLLALDDRVAEIVKALKERGMESPYLKTFVVARLNPLRFKKSPTADFDETFEKMEASAKKFDAGSIKREDIARAPPIPDGGE